jgi:hypothetical protein
VVLGALCSVSKQQQLLGGWHNRINQLGVRRGGWYSGVAEREREHEVKRYNDDDGDVWVMRSNVNTRVGSSKRWGAKL